MSSSHRGRLLISVALTTLLLLVACRSGQLDPRSGTPSATETAAIEAASSAPATSAATPAEAGPPTGTPPAEVAPEQAGRFFASPEYGIHTFLWWRPEIARRDLALVQDLGFGWVKQSFAWRDIEGLEPGKYDWYRPDLIVDEIEEAGLKLLVRLDRQPFWSQAPGEELQENAPPADLADFSRFCGVVADRYRGRIAGYQVWNEPNLSREWGERPPDPAAYTELLKGCYLAIKGADPGAIVVSAGLAPTGTEPPVAMPDDVFLQGMYDAGAADYFDVLGVNAPGYKAPPEVSPEEAEARAEYGGGRWFAFRHVEDLRQIMVANGDAETQISVLELGWTTDRVNIEYAWHAVSEAEQADYLVRAYRYAAENWQPWIGLMVAIYIADYDWSPETHEQWWWAITLPDGSPRPAYEALKAMDKVSTPRD
jgi:polysaccharide biosynthesis protein PslG